MTRAEGDAAPPETTVSLDYFTGLYLAKDDPWDIASKWHDRRKFAVTMASLPRERYERCYEPGASVGTLTRMLAGRCGEVLAVDSVPEAVDLLRQNTADLPNVRAERAELPAEPPDGTFDLVVIGDLLYYLSAADLTALLDGLVQRLEPGGDLVSVHFRDRETGGNYDGFNAHAALFATAGLTPVVHHEDEWFLLDVLRRSDDVA
ncbi:trans-aconitate methyltransferase [Actinoplanes campanulatus]|uniref:Trans-aconitate methyltransferase n=1 Tax=Actinoplanes campanulatus TaxID=113559 RepID=A0A7W5FEA8_9ACTN|nr:class I SAM-dependent methyltransferase [Actinoplanes campanulatus]MBB3095201.1 trans-aconitate methyltransferase [Actinoplanes campanulatus]GGN24115.1 methyltransferase [Actinoplanes campanulatus]GID34805.1 methyltransferase [Actinoplanes campanulatus]